MSSAQSGDLRRARSAGLLALAFACLPAPAVAMSGELAACPEPPPLGAEPTNPEEWRERIEASRQRYEAFACRARLDLALRNAERLRIRDSQGAIEDFAADGTLQHGDVVVTTQGFRVFGGRHDTRRGENFYPLDGTGASPRLRRVLRDMEKASGFRGASPRQR